MSIVTRPTQGTDVCTVRDGRADIETGVTRLTTTGVGAGTTLSFPQAFVRIGVAPRAEINFGLPSYERSFIGGVTTNGGSDISMGAKWEMGYTAKASWGANVQVTEPTGSAAFTAGRTQYTANANWAYTLNSTWSIAGTFSFNSLAGTDANGAVRNYGVFMPTVLVGATLPANSEIEAEYVYFSAAGPGLASKSLIDGAYVRDLNNALQFDIEYGFQPTPLNGQRTHYIGAGLSFMP